MQSRTPCLPPLAVSASRAAAFLREQNLGLGHCWGVRAAGRCSRGNDTTGWNSLARGVGTGRGVWRLVWEACNCPLGICFACRLKRKAEGTHKSLDRFRPQTHARTHTHTHNTHTHTHTHTHDTQEDKQPEREGHTYARMGDRHTDALRQTWALRP